MSDTNALTEADIAAIRAVTEAFPGHMQGGDAAALAAALYTEDAVLMAQGTPAVQGHAAIGEVLGGFPPVTRFDIAIDEIDGRGDLAYVRGTFAMTMEPEGAPEPVQMAGKYIEIRRRQADGSWPIVADIFNSDADG